MRKSALCILFLLCLLCKNTVLAQDPAWKAAQDSAVALLERGDAAGALEFSQTALKIALKKSGKKDTTYLQSLNAVATSYAYLEEYEKAAAAFKELADISATVYGMQSADYAYALNGVASMKEALGQYSEALPLYREVLAIFKKTIGEEHSDYGTGLNNLANLYHSMQEFALAEKTYNESRLLRERTTGKDNTDYATLISNLATLYIEYGRYSDAEPLLKEAITIRKKINGEHHPEYLIPLQNLALVYKAFGEYDRAEPLLREVVELRREIYGEHHPGYARSLNNLAALYSEQKEYAKAEKLYKEAVEIDKNNFGADHPRYALTLQNLSTVYTNTLRFADAERALLTVKDIFKKKLGKLHQDYALAVSNLAVLYGRWGKPAQAEPLFKESQAVAHEYIVKNFPFLSESEKEEYWAQQNVEYRYFTAFALKNYRQKPQLAAQLYDNQLYTKALLLNSLSAIRGQLTASRDPKIIQTFTQWKNTREQISQLYTQTEDERTVNLDSLENIANNQEKILSENSEVFKMNQKPSSWRDIQNVLKPGEAAVEIIRSQTYESEWTDTVLYAALIITKSSKFPEMVVIENGNELEEKFLPMYRKAVYENRRTELLKTNPLLDNGKLYEAFWQPFKSALQGISRVYLSPDGVYNQLNLLTLYNSHEGKFLLDETDVRLVTNTRDLLESKNSAFKKNGNTAALFGYPQYDLDSASHVQSAERYQERNTISGGGISREFQSAFAESFKSSESAERGGISMLPGTKVEVEKIGKIFKENAWDAQLFTGSEALEEAVKSIAAPRVLHIATHGYFLSALKKDNAKIIGMERSRIVVNPLLRSGLLLAGAERSLKKGRNSEIKDDGILTAFEASNINLSGTEIVVLSACETGLGTVANGEGVYGLQRSFRIAGAESVLMSLWQVDDVATQKIMVKFYTNWIANGMEKRDAFLKAQRDLRDEYIAPYYWGAFVMSGR